MLRTRDFILVFTAIVFLVTAIGATIFVQGTSTSATAAAYDAALQRQLALDEGRDYTAVIASRASLTRAERIAQMRTKIAETTFMAAPAPEPELTEGEVAATTSSETEVATGLLQCAGATDYMGFWDARNLTVVASEGATLVVRVDVLPNGSTTDTTVLQLPKRLAAAPGQSCIGSDVIGIANDGSLIRNDEQVLYSVFGAETRIGYALDGFPIHGTGAASVDACGGRVEGGQYRYELQPDAETIINCFSAAPVLVP